MNEKDAPEKVMRMCCLCGNERLLSSFSGDENECRWCLINIKKEAECRKNLKNWIKLVGWKPTEAIKARLKPSERTVRPISLSDYTVYKGQAGMLRKRTL